MSFVGQPHTLACCYARRFSGFAYDVEADIQQYKQYAERLDPFIDDTIEYINNAHDSGKRILIEGANATMLDLDFGTYPFVTSSNPSIGGIATGLGLAPSKYDAIVGVVSGCSVQGVMGVVFRLL